MKKLLIGYYANIPGSGIDKYLHQVIKALSPLGIEIGVLTSSSNVEFPGVRIHQIPRIPHPKQRVESIRTIIEKNAYDTVYFNISNAYDVQGNLAAAKASNRPRIFTHSHNSGPVDENALKRHVFSWIHFLYRPVLVKNTDVFLSCSGLAADWLYGSHPYELVRNSTDTARFAFSEKARSTWRAKLGLKDAFVIGYAGRLSYQKNIFFLLEFLKALLPHVPNAKLVLFGDGPLKPEFESTVASSGLANAVLLAGVTDSLHQAYSAMDLFVLPSRLEGMPLVGIEAQANGLPCVFSNTVTPEVKISEPVVFIDTENFDISPVLPLVGLERGPAKLHANCGIDEKDQAEQLRHLFDDGK